MDLRKSIASKLFLITLGFFSSFIIITLLFQSLSFQKFYQNRKMKNLRVNLEKLRTDYNSSTGLNDVLTLIKDFEDKNNCKVVILDSKGNLNFITDLNNRAVNGSRLRAIREIVDAWTSNPDAFIKLKESGKSITYISKSSFGGIKNIVCISPDNSANEVFFAVSSFQPINEASSVIKEFYIYIFAGAGILIIILSIIYANMITKPLLKLNATANKMANLDFSEKCAVESDDEIGNLAATMNFLSSNLETSLSSLKAANKKLLQDIEKERELEKMRREFVAGVSHELKTPISLIEGYAEALKDNVAEENERDYYLDVIIDESQNMGKLVSEMLNLARLESGNMKLNMESFNIGALMDEIVRKYSNAMAEKNISLSYSSNEKLNVNGDISKIEQVIRNLLTNAIRYSDVSGSIYINTFEKADDVFIEIENTGQHIADDQMDKIWEKFYRVEKSRNRNLGGTGLGLSIVKNILVLHNSNFGVQNTERGVKFYFSLKKSQTHRNI